MRTIQIKRGTAANTPPLADGELGLQTDAGKIVVGNKGANLGIAMDKDLNTAKTELNAAIAGRAPASHTHTADQVGARPSNWTPSKWDVGLGNVDNTADSQKSVNYAGSSGNTNAVGGRASSTVLAEIDNLKTSVANGKAQIASAISDKGVSTGAGADFGTMANNIRAIDTGAKFVRLTPSLGNDATITYTASQLFGSNVAIHLVVLIVNGKYVNGVIQDGVEMRVNDKLDWYPEFRGCTTTSFTVSTTNVDTPIIYVVGQ